VNNYETNISLNKFNKAINKIFPILIFIMGNCCFSYVPSCDNDAENYIRDVLKSLRIRNYCYEDLKEHYDSNVRSEINKRMLVWSEDAKKTLEGRLFKYFKDYLFIDNVAKNPHQFFHNHIFDYNNEDEIDDNPEFYFFTFILSMIKGNKADIIEKILKIDKKYDSYEGFKHFLTLYLEVNILKFTKRIDEGFKELYNETIHNKRVTNGKLTVTPSFMKSSRDLEKQVFNQIKLKKLIDLILKTFDKIVLGLNTDKRKLKTSPITFEHLTDLTIEFPWLFEWDKLRNFLYTNRSIL
jgi:hypothetical protein